MMNRVYHTWDEWECYPAGFYESAHKDSIPAEECERMYAAFLRDTKRFLAALDRVLMEWPNSCEHYLTNENMNRVAWLGQAAACIDMNMPSCYRGGFNYLSDVEKGLANNVALSALNKWLQSRGEMTLTIAEAASKTKANLY